MSVMQVGKWARGVALPPDWWVPKADGRTLHADFRTGEFWDNVAGALPIGAFAAFDRNSDAGRHSPFGLFEPVAADLIRRDFDPATGAALGALLEAAATYARVNSLMTGLIAGSPGTAPDGWSIPAPAGLTRTLSLVTTSGRPKLRVHYAGAPAANFQFLLQMIPSLTLAAASGQVWTYGARFSCGGTGLDGNSLALSHWETDGANAILRSGAVGGTSPLAHTRRSTTVTLGVSTAYLRLLLGSGIIAAGTTCDFWIDIEAPQLTQTAYLPSELLVGAAGATRLADDLSRPIAGHIGAAEGGLFFEAAPIDAATAQILGGLYWPSGDLIEARRTASDRIVVEAVSSGVQVAYLDLGAHVGGALVKVALGWAEDDFAARMSGGSLLTDGSFPIPAGEPTLRLGSRPGPVYLLNGHLRQATVYPARAIMTNAKIGELVG